MRHQCSECGNEIPESMDFCPHCGCLKSKSIPIDESGVTVAICPDCGHEISPSDSFCGNCGADLSHCHAPQPIRYPVMRKHAVLAIVLATIPGFFNIYGLGHFVLGKWSRGCMFLVMSAVMWYINGWQLASSNYFILLLNLLLFFFQISDIMRLAYSPEDK